MVEEVHPILSLQIKFIKLTHFCFTISPFIFVSDSNSEAEALWRSLALYTEAVPVAELYLAKFL